MRSLFPRRVPLDRWSRVRRWSTAALVAALVAVLLPATARANDPEPNDSLAAATGITVGLAGRAGALSSATDVDSYTFVAPYTGTYTVELFNAAPALDGACLIGYNASQARTGESCVGSGLTVARLEITTNAGQRTYVRASHPLRRMGNYSIRVLPPAAQMSWSPDSEPNNSLATASPLAASRWSVQTLYSLPGAYAHEGPDVDVFRLATTAGRDYTVSTANLADTMGRALILKVYSPTGTLLASSGACAQGSANPCNELTVTAPGEAVFALVTSTGTARHGQYWLCGRPSGAGCSYGEVDQFGDLNSDGTPDVLAVHDDGTLQLYATLGPTVSAPTPVGQGWNTFRWLSLVPDMDGDGRTDLIGLRTDGLMFAYQGVGGGRFGNALQVGKGWQSMSLMTVLDDITGDGRPDLVARSGDGFLIRYSFSSTGVLSNARVIGKNWSGIRLTTTVDDFSGDGIADLLAITEDGDLVRYAFNEGGVITNAAQVGRHWNAMGLVTAPGDINNDRRRDLVSLRDDGTMWAYWNNGSSWGGPAQLASGLGGIRLLA
ncbi:VCBS repeat-containing protein [Tessaracoccus sp. SD287]|uniref:FG-GAP repeat domain-containing protein n=1 Tax=Tessaracoccus sp. SD287 TaxID=2782008 RepID=UPI001A95CDDB|nr:VCBS repeat-containing protein [Tessaracoccus sp. SD287]MBO1030551.1 VCBS repeat-containing protein [Tessaracoccus sp. SD287]